MVLFQRHRRAPGVRPQATLTPPIPIPVDALAGELLARRIGDDDYAISIDAGERGRLAVGRIMRVARSAGRGAWLWTVTGPAAPDAGVGLSGEAESLEAARAAFRGSLEELRAWAVRERGGMLRWHLGEG